MASQQEYRNTHRFNYSENAIVNDLWTDMFNKWSCCTSLFRKYCGGGDE